MSGPTFASRRGERPVAAIECRDLRDDRARGSGVVEGVVRAREPRRARELRGHDRAHLGVGEPASRHDATDLLVLRAIDDQHPIDGRTGRRARGGAGPPGVRRGSSRRPPPVARRRGSADGGSPRAGRGPASANTRRRSAARSIVPSGRRYSGPNAASTASYPGSPGAVSACARASESVTSMPRRRERARHGGLAAADAAREADDERPAGPVFTHARRGRQATEAKGAAAGFTERRS